MSTHHIAPRGAAVEGPLTEQAQAGLDALRDDPMITAAAMVLSLPRGPLPGAITIQRRTSAGASPATAPAGLAPLYVPPTKAGAAALRVGEDIAAMVLTEGVPTTLAGRAAQYARVNGIVSAEHRGLGLQRRGPLIGEAAAGHYINHAQPANLTFVPLGQLRRFYDDRLDALACPAHSPRTTDPDDADAESGPLAAAVRDAHAAGYPASSTADPADPADPADLADLADAGDVCECGNVHSAPLTAALTSRRRLAWSPRTGIADGLLLDRFHHTHYGTVIGRDTAIQAHVIDDMRRMGAFLAPADNLTDRTHAGHVGHGSDEATLAYLEGAILGVRVISHLVPGDAVHYLPTFTDGTVALGDQHRVGDCETCMCTSDLPNSRSVSTNFYDLDGCEAGTEQQRHHQAVRPSAGLFNPTGAYRPDTSSSKDADAPTGATSHPGAPDEQAGVATEPSVAGRAS